MDVSRKAEVAKDKIAVNIIIKADINIDSNLIDANRKQIVRSTKVFLDTDNFLKSLFFSSMIKELSFDKNESAKFYLL